MGEWFFDESIQERGGFIVGAFVYANRDPAPAVDTALIAAGLRPGVDEYKSGDRVTPALSQLRDALFGIVQKFKIGLLVMPSSKRSELGDELLWCLEKTLFANALQLPHKVHVDTGIKAGAETERIFRSKFGPCCEIAWDQDSKIIRGLQLADLVAHYLGTMLLSEMGEVTKKVRAGEGSGYLPDLEVDLGFKLWAGLRYSFFNSGRSIGDEPDNPNLSQKFLSGTQLDLEESLALRTVDVGSYGLHIAASCDTQLRAAALARFGQCYLGCIH